MHEAKPKDIIVLEYFLKNPDSFISEISEALSISKSSIQRYLQKYLDVVIEDRNITIKEQLEINRRNGQKKGGNNSFKNNDPIRDASGNFIGSVKTTSQVDKEEQKKKDIILITNYYLENPSSTLDEVASFFEELGMFSKYYVYECLTGSKTKEILGEETFRKIKEILEANQYSFKRKVSDIDIESIIELADLTEDEKKLIKLRMTGNISLDELAKEFGVSRTTVEEYEKKAIEKLRKANKKETK